MAADSTLPVPQVTGGLLGRLAVEGLDLGGDGGVLLGDGPVGNALWWSRLSLLSECLEVSDPGHEVGCDSGRVGGLGLVSDRVVVLDFVDKDGGRATEDLLDQAVGVELVVVEPVPFIPQASSTQIVERIGDEDEVLQELAGHILIGPVMVERQF